MRYASAPKQVHLCVVLALYAHTYVVYNIYNSSLIRRFFHKYIIYISILQQISAARIPYTSPITQFDQYLL